MTVSNNVDSKIFNSHFYFCSRVMLGKNRISKFFEWSFGQQIDDSTSMKFIIDNWNKRKGDIFKVSSSEGELNIFNKILYEYTANVLNESTELLITIEEAESK